MRVNTQIRECAFATICGFAGIATTFAGFWDLRKITAPGRDTEYMDYVAMVGVTSMGLAMLTLCFLLLVNKNWAGFVALTFIGIAVVAFAIGAFHMNVYLGISLIAGVFFVVGIQLRKP
jgi:hypothetical protein